MGTLRKNPQIGVTLRPLTLAWAQREAARQARPLSNYLASLIETRYREVVAVQSHRLTAAGKTGKPRAPGGEAPPF